MSEIGTYQYQESNVSKEVPDFIMSSTITGMSDNQQNVTTDVSKNGDERVGTNMVTAR